jgi:hypothetical protein
MRKIAAAFSLPLLLSSCATIFTGGGTQNVSVQSTPTGAKISIVNADGLEVHSSSTPATVALNKGAGYFRGAHYVVKFSMPGYKAHEAIIASTVSGWYFGNIFIGGLIGMLAVDPVTGAMYTLNPTSIDGKLAASTSDLKHGKTTLQVVLLQELHVQQLGQLKAVKN